MISDIFEVAIRTDTKTREVEIVQESLSRTNNRVAFLTESSIVSANGTLLITRVTSMVSEVLIETIRTD